MFYSFLSDQLASFDSGWVLNSFTTPIAILVVVVCVVCVVVSFALVLLAVGTFNILTTTSRLGN
jgi:hypothetical protein